MPAENQSEAVLVLSSETVFGFLMMSRASALDIAERIMA